MRNKPPPDLEMSPLDPVPMIERIARVLGNDDWRTHEATARRILGALRRATPDMALAMSDMGRRRFHMSFSPIEWGDYDLCYAQMWIAGVDRELGR